MRTANTLIISLLSLAMVGCASRGLPSNYQPNDPDFAPVPAQNLAPPPSQDGSIWQTSYGMNLYGDKTAHRIGDLITIMLEESTKSKKSSKAATSKNSSTEIAAPTVFGGPVSLFGNTLDANLSGNSTFNGSGSADQSQSLQGAITVTVADVLPNGTLRVRGEKWMTLNTGSELIRVNGLVRPEDISLDNTVSSQKLADAQIIYSGTGAMADASSQGWMSRFFTSPYWPF